MVANAKFQTEAKCLGALFWDRYRFNPKQCNGVTWSALYGSKQRDFREWATFEKEDKMIVANQRFGLQILESNESNLISCKNQEMNQDLPRPCGSG